MTSITILFLIKLGGISLCIYILYVIIQHIMSRYTTGLNFYSSPYIGDNTIETLLNYNRLVEWKLDIARHFLRLNDKTTHYVTSNIGFPLQVEIINRELLEDISKRGLRTGMIGHGCVFNDTFEDFLGKYEISNVDGELWREQRRRLLPFFNKYTLIPHLTAVTQKHGDKLIALIKQSAGVVEIQELCGRLTFSIISELVFGSKVDTSVLIDPFDRMCKHIIYRGFTPMFIWKLCRWFGCNGEDQFAKDKIYFRQTIDKYVKESDDGFVHNLLHDKSVDSDRIYGCITSLISGGRDTTASTLTFIFYVLGGMPEYQQLLRDKVHEHKGNDVIPEIDWMMKEVLRLHGPGPINMKEVLNGDYKMPDGGVIPKGSLVFYSPYIINRLPTIWDNPDLFLPERWKKISSIPASTFPTFNIEPRICMGKIMTFTELHLLICMFLTSFKWSIVKVCTPLMYEQSIFLKIKDGLNIRFTTLT